MHEFIKATILKEANRVLNEEGRTVGLIMKMRAYILKEYGFEVKLKDIKKIIANSGIKRKSVWENGKTHRYYC